MHKKYEVNIINNYCESVASLAIELTAKCKLQTVIDRKTEIKFIGLN